MTTVVVICQAEAGKTVETIALTSNQSVVSTVARLLLDDIESNASLPRDSSAFAPLRHGRRRALAALAQDASYTA